MRRQYRISGTAIVIPWSPSSKYKDLLMNQWISLSNQARNLYAQPLDQGVAISPASSLFSREEESGHGTVSEALLLHPGLDNFSIILVEMLRVEMLDLSKEATSVWPVQI